MTSARFHLARWNLLHAQACIDVTMARHRREDTAERTPPRGHRREDTAALEAWADICAMRRAYWAEEWAHQPEVA